VGYLAQKAGGKVAVEASGLRSCALQAPFGREVGLRLRPHGGAVRGLLLRGLVDGGTCQQLGQHGTRGQGLGCFEAGAGWVEGVVGVVWPAGETRRVGQAAPVLLYGGERPPVAVRGGKDEAPSVGCGDVAGRLRVASLRRSAVGSAGQGNGL
jgi:hypothetical protein